MEPSKGLFSLVVPVLDEEDVLEQTYRALSEVLAGLGRPYEVIVVDNGSTDATPAIAARLCRLDPRWRYLRLSRNFGYQCSITAGMLASAGEAVMVVDADLQDPPELIPEFIRLWEQGHDIVFGVRERRIGEPWYRVWPTMLAMRLITWMSEDPKLPAHSGDFRLISGRVRDALVLLPECNRYMRGIIHWLGFAQVGVPYTRRGRARGRSKVNWSYLVGFTFNAIVNHSLKPIRAFTFAGGALLALTASLVVGSLVGVAEVSAGAILSLLNLAATCLAAGVIGEYVGKLHVESKRRPLFFVDYTVNLDTARLVHPGDAAAGRPLPDAVRREENRSAA